MLELRQVHSKLLVAKGGKEYMIGACTVDGAGDDDTVWNVFEYSWDDGLDLTKPFFTESARAVVHRREPQVLCRH